MTSLPITIPKGYSLAVKKGDSVKAGQLLAEKQPSSDTSIENQVPQSDSLTGEEQSIDLAEALGVNPTSARKYVEKAPGDSVATGEVIASKGMSLGFKREQILSSVTGTVVRFERDTGRLVIRTTSSSSVVQPVKAATPPTIVAPLAGTITHCDEDSIIIETDSTSKAITGSMGSGGAAKGEVVVMTPEKGNETISSPQITKEYAGKILLLPSIDKEAVAKASALGVAGILGTEMPADLFTYLESRKIDLPVIVIDPAIGKKLVKGKTEVIMHGAEKAVVPQE